MSGYTPAEGSQPIQLMDARRSSIDVESNLSIETGIHADEKPKHSLTFEESFKIEQLKWNDRPFILVFALILVGFISLFAHVFSTCINAALQDTTTSSDLNRELANLMGFIVLIGFGLSYLGMLLIKLNPSRFIKWSLLFNTLTNLFIATSAIINGNYLIGAVFGITTIVYVAFYFNNKSRIEFSSIILNTLIAVVNNNLKTFTIISIYSGLSTFLFLAIAAITTAGVFVKWGLNEEDEFKNLNLFVYFGLFSFFASFYISEIIKNIIHVTISGVFSTWYYLSNNDGLPMPRNAAMGSFKRSITYSFGSVCFGSLIVAMIETVKLSLQLIRNLALQQDHPLAYAFSLIFEFIFTVVEDLVKWFNRYAYSYISIYGKSFLRSSRETFEIIRVKGLTALVNDCLINSALSWYSLFVGYLCGLTSLAYAFSFKPLWLQDADGLISIEGSEVIGLIVVSFIIGLFISNIITNIIESGSVTFFVALAKNPEVLQFNSPEVFQQIFEHYPDVLNKVVS